MPLQRCNVFHATEEEFGDEELDAGYRKVKVHTLQVVRGNGEWFAIVQPSIKPCYLGLDVAAAKDQWNSSCTETIVEKD